MTEPNKKKKEQLGMDAGTASSRLRKSLIFKMVQLLESDNCYQCGKKIMTVEEPSIEHKIPWLDSNNPAKLFFDLDNVAFSHLKCNIGAARQTQKRSHSSHSAYRSECRCNECKEIERLRRQSQRKSTKFKKQ